MEKYLSLLNQYHSKSKSNTSYTNNNDYFIPISNQEKPKLDNLPSHREERVSDIKILLNKCNINRDKHDHHSIESVKYKNSLQIKTENAVNINNNSNSNGKIFSKTSDMNQDTRSQSTLYVNTSDSEHLILEETKSKKTDSEETIVDNSITDETISDQSNSEKQIYNEIKMQKEKLSPPIEEDQLAFLERRFEAIIEDIIPLIIIFREKVENYPNNVSLKDLNDSYQLIKCLLMKQLNLINNIKINDSKVQEEHKFTMTLIQELLFKIDVQKNEFFKKEKEKEKEKEKKSISISIN